MKSISPKAHFHQPVIKYSVKKKYQQQTFVTEYVEKQYMIGRNVMTEDSRPNRPPHIIFLGTT